MGSVCSKIGITIFYFYTQLTREEQNCLKYIIFIFETHICARLTFICPWIDQLNIQKIGIESRLEILFSCSEILVFFLTIVLMWMFNIVLVWFGPVSGLALARPCLDYSQRL